MTDLIDEPEDYCPADFAVMSVLSIKAKPMYKSGIMKECIRRYGDLIEHGPYLYGEYSDDVDEAVEGLCSQGVLRRDPSGTTYKISLTEYGENLFITFLHTQTEDDDLEAIKLEILGGAFQ